MQMVRIYFTYLLCYRQGTMLTGKKGKKRRHRGNYKQRTRSVKACMTAVSPRLPCKTSLVMRSEERRLYALTKDETEL